VTLAYEPSTGELDATAVIEAQVGNADLGRFSFDLQPNLKVSAVAVDDTEAAYQQVDDKLRIYPANPVSSGTPMTVQVHYSGVPDEIRARGSHSSPGGWFRLKDGGAVAIGEPLSASAWYPVNEIQTDRARFAVIATVPEPFEVVSNGLPIESGLPESPEGYRTFGWSDSSEMSSYLTTIYIDDFDSTRTVTSDGIPIMNAYGPGTDDIRTFAEQTETYLEFLSAQFGPYPFDSAGGIFLEDQFGFALETQTRPVYAGFASETVIVHELAHQWFGNVITIESWADICLNECFASYAEWLWSEEKGSDLDARYRSTMETYSSSEEFWALPLVDMGAGSEFSDVYSRGPLAIHALRTEMGDDLFRELVLSWVEQQTNETASWPEFAELVNTLAGRNLDDFLSAWFLTSGLPDEQFR
jgi:aminopeptidase N